MLTNLLLQLGAIFIPLGFTGFFFGADLLSGWKFIAVSLLSIIIFGFGFWCLRGAIQWTRLEERENDVKFEMLIKEIRLLRQDLNGGSRNGGNQGDNPRGKTKS